MRKFLLLFLFIYFCTSAYNQVIKGTIIDEKTKEKIFSASVYFNGTFTGTTSDHVGHFELDCSKNTSMPLIISAIGYYSITLTHFLRAEPFLIQMKPKEYQFKEAVVTSRSFARKRKRNLVLFKDEFLGTTENVQGCKILNERDITFNYDSDKDTLKAFALKPIQIENSALGYKVTYFLDKFEYYKEKEATFFSGNIVFNEDEATVVNQKQFNENRKSAYLGSRMHFFRSLWSDKLKSNEFAISNSTSKNLKFKDIVLQDHKSNKFFNYPEKLKITYKYKVSYINFLTKNVYFDKVGYFDPCGINWIGYMGNQRIADWLPYEYTTE